MAFATYADLQAELVRWLGERTDLVAQVPSFITLAEEAMSGDLRCREMHERAVAILNEEFEYLPANFGAVDYVAFGSGNGDRRQLRYRTMAQLDNVQLNGDDQSEPCHYSIVGSQIRFWPKPSAIIIPPGVDPDLEPEKCRHFELVYWTKVLPLSSTVASNVVLATYPSLYLYGSLIAAEPYILNDPRLQTWTALYDAALRRANEGDKMDTLGTLAISGPEYCP